MSQKHLASNRTHQIPKSLHTITVFVRVAKLIQATDQTGLRNDDAIERAAAVLGYGDTPDNYELKAKALKQLNEGKSA